WGMNGYAQSMIWPSVMRIIACYFPENSKIRAFMWLSSTSPAGTLGSYAISAWTIEVFDVSAAFLFPSVLMLAAGLLFVIAFPKEIFTVENSNPTRKATAEGSTRAPLGKILLTPIVLIALIPTFVQGIIKDGLTAWVPSYISEIFHAEAVTAILVTMALPIINLFGTYAVGILQKRIKGELPLASLFFLLAGISLGVLLLFGSKSLIIALGMLGVSSASILAVNTVFINFLPLRFSTLGRASFISGFLNAVGYGGAAASSYGIGVTADLFGWDITILIFIVLIVLSCLLCFFSGKKLKPTNIPTRL
ncbi:MAG: MFS transporter, partial [Oscillospiraceae bacterium]